MSRRFVDDYFNDVYEFYLLLSRVLTGLALLAFGISLTGLFGMATLIAGRRMREVGVRKVHGASGARMVGMLLASFSMPVLAANLSSGRSRTSRRASISTRSRHRSPSRRCRSCCRSRSPSRSRGSRSARRRSMPRGRDRPTCCATSDGDHDEKTPCCARQRDQGVRAPIRSISTEELDQQKERTAKLRSSFAERSRAHGNVSPDAAAEHDGPLRAPARRRTPRRPRTPSPRAGGARRPSPETRFAGIA